MPRPVPIEIPSKSIALTKLKELGTGLGATEAEQQEAFNKIDKDGSGTLDKTENFGFPG